MHVLCFHFGRVLALGLPCEMQGLIHRGALPALLYPELFNQGGE